MKALVTGAGGFLGGAMARQLVERGDSVRGFSRGEYPSLAALGIEQKRGDLSDPIAVSAAVRGCDIVFHVAAVPGYWGPYQVYYDVNVTGTRNIISACRKHGVGKLVYTSSPSVVFDGNDMRGINESIPYPERYLTAYPATKAIAERTILSTNSPDLMTVSLRPHLIWGPGDNHLTPRIFAKARAGKLILIGNGENLIDTVYVDNAARAHLQAADALVPNSAVAGKAYFISNGEPMTIKHVLNKMIETINLPPLKRTVPPKAAYAAGWVLENIYSIFRIRSEPLVTRFIAEEFSTSHWFDISAARRDFGYRPEDIPFVEGLRRFKEHLDATSG